MKLQVNGAWIQPQTLRGTGNRGREPPCSVGDGVAAGLTAKEYALLEFLALHRGELVTRTAIYDHLFDETDDTLSNLLDVYVSNLRRKLGHELIETRRGQGYMIHDEAPVDHE